VPLDGGLSDRAMFMPRGRVGVFCESSR